MKGYCDKCGLRVRLAGTSGRFCECAIGLREFLGMTSDEMEEYQNLGFRRTSKLTDMYVTLAIGLMRFRLKARRFFKEAIRR